MIVATITAAADVVSIVIIACSSESDLQKSQVPEDADGYCGGATTIPSWLTEHLADRLKTWESLSSRFALQYCCC